MWALPAPPTHFLTDTPIQSLWDSLIIPQQINCPSKPFSSRHTKPSPVIQSHHSSIDYLPLQAISEPTRQAKPCEKGLVILHNITFPTNPFLNQHANPNAVSQSHHPPTDYLPLQAIFEPTRQAPWGSPTIPHQITCPSKPFLNQHAKRCDPVPSFLIRFIIHQWLLWHKSNFLYFCKCIFCCLICLLLRKTHLQDLFLCFSRKSL